MKTWNSPTYQQVERAALRIAKEHGASEIEPFHMLAALLESNAPGSDHVLNCLGADKATMQHECSSILRNWSAATSQNDADPQHSEAMYMVATKAIQIAHSLKRPDVSTEHLLYALTAEIREIPAIYLSNKGVTNQRVRMCITSHF